MRCVKRFVTDSAAFNNVEQCQWQTLLNITQLFMNKNNLIIHAQCTCLVFKVQYMYM